MLAEAVRLLRHIEPDCNCSDVSEFLDAYRKGLVIARAPVPGGVLEAEWCLQCRTPMLQLATNGVVVDGPCRCEPFPSDARELALKALRILHPRRDVWRTPTDAEAENIDDAIAALSEGK